MKYLILTNHSYMLWQFRRELIDRLAESAEVVISTPFVGHEDDFQKKYKCIETDVDRRGIDPVTDIHLYNVYKRMLKAEKPDVVITYSIKPNIYGGYACQRLGIPYCVNVQGLGTAFQKEPIAAIVTAMYKVALRKVKTVFFENTDNAEVFIHRNIVAQDKITVLHGAGVNLKRFEYREYPSEDHGIRFLFLGRIMREKGIDELIQAIRSLKKKYGEKIRFDFVGFFEDEYKEIVEGLDRDGLIQFHGFQSDPRPYYAAAHCVVLPSYHEGMSNVLLEAAAMGRALICSDIPGCREAVDDGVNGFLCKKKDPESLELAMEKVMSLHRDEREEMGRKGRQKMEREFDKEMVVRNTFEAIQKCSGN